MIPIFMDIEASGLGYGSYPIEVGLALSNETTFCTLIKPERDWTHWDDSAEHCHGLKRRTLARHGKSVVHVAKKLNALLAEKTVYSDAWGNDSAWLDMIFEAAEVSRHFRVESLRSLLAEEQAPHWHETKEDVISRLKLTRHRASSDALILQTTYQRIQQKYKVVTGEFTSSAYTKDKTAA